jgi:ATP-dependent Clp protease ATP-binding subunit ClpB
MLRQTIRPEFLNRIDETIVFTPLSREDITEIVRLQFKLLVKRLSTSDFKIEISEEAVNWLATIGFDPHFGARPVKRILQKYVLNELSKRILAGTVQKDKPVIIDVKDSELIFRN